MKTARPPFLDTPLVHGLLEIYPTAIAIADYSNTIVYVNVRLCELLGFLPEELVGQSTKSLLPGIPLCGQERDQVSPLLHPVDRRSSHITQESTTVLAKNRENEQVPLAIKLYKISDKDQSFLLIQLADVGQVLIDHQLRESEHFAAIAQTIDGLAHESRNTLQKAVSSLDLLELDFKNNPEQLILSNRIRESLSDLLTHYDDVRRYAQPIVIKPEKVRLRKLCQSVFNEILIERDNFSHQLKFAPVPKYTDVAMVDRDEMKRVLRHLLANAIDAAAHRATIELDASHLETQDGTFLNLILRDHGNGFDQRSLDQAFVPFYTTKQHGTGLGLAICRRVIEAHHGKITASNHPDGGAAVEIRIPQSF